MNLKYKVRKKKYEDEEDWDEEEKYDDDEDWDEDWDDYEDLRDEFF